MAAAGAGEAAEANAAAGEAGPGVDSRAVVVDIMCMGSRWMRSSSTERGFQGV